MAKPLGSELVVTLRAAPTTIERACVAVCAVGVVLSVALTVKLYVPEAVGVPEIVLPLSVRPVGSEPAEMDHVYGLVPPLAASVCEYAVLVVPLGRDVVVTPRPAPTTIERACVAVSAVGVVLSVALTVKL